MLAPTLPHQYYEFSSAAERKGMGGWARAHRLPDIPRVHLHYEKLSGGLRKGSPYCS